MSFLDSFQQNLTPGLKEAVSGFQNANVGSILGGLAKLPGDALSFNPVSNANQAISAIGNTHATGAEKALVGFGALAGLVGGAEAFHNWRSGGVPDEAGMLTIPGGPSDMGALKGTTVPSPHVGTFDFKTVQALRNGDSYENLARNMGSYSGDPALVGRQRQVLAGHLSTYGERLTSEIPDHAQAVPQYQNPMQAGPAAASYELAKFHEAVSRGIFNQDPAAKPFIKTYQQLLEDPTRVKPEAAAALTNFMVQYAKDSSFVSDPSHVIGLNQKVLSAHYFPDGFHFTSSTFGPAADMTTEAGRTKALQRLDHETLVPQIKQNMANVLALTTDEERSKNWYQIEHDGIREAIDQFNAKRVSQGLNPLDPDHLYAAVSLTSAAQEYGQGGSQANLNKALQALSKAPHLTADDMPGQMVSQADIDKINRLATETPSDLFFNKDAAQFARGQKQPSFYLNLAFPDLFGAATIDRHMYDVGLGFETGVMKRPLDKLGWQPGSGVYDSYHSALNQLAMEKGMSPNQLQGVIWDKWKSLKEDWHGTPSGRGWAGKKGPFVFDRTILDQMEGHDESLPTIARQVPAASPAPLPADVPTGRKAQDGAFLVSQPDGLSVVGKPLSGNRSLFRVLYPGGMEDPVRLPGDNVRFWRVLPRVVDANDDLPRRAVLGSQELGSKTPDAERFERIPDPTLAVHPGNQPGNFLVFHDASKDGQAVQAMSDLLSKNYPALYRSGTPYRSASVVGTVRGPDFGTDHLEADVQSKHWITISGNRASQSAAKNASAHAALGDELRQLGYKPIESEGVYKGQGEPSYLVPGMPYSEALRLGKKYGQESVLGPHGLFYTSGPDAGTFNPAQPGEVQFYGPGDTLPDAYTKIGDKVFSQDIDFSQSHPIEPNVDERTYRTETTPQRGLVVDLGDKPNPAALNAVWQHIQALSKSMDVKGSLYLHGDAAAPAGAVRAYDHLFTDKSGTHMVHRTQAENLGADHAVPVYVSQDEFDKLAPNTNHIDTPQDALSYEQRGDRAIVNGSAYVTSRSTNPTLSKSNVLASKLDGEPVRAVGISIPLHPEAGGQGPVDLPTLALGASPDEAIAGLVPGGRSVVAVKTGKTWELHMTSQDPLLEYQARQLLYRLGASSAGAYRAQVVA